MLEVSKATDKTNFALAYLKRMAHCGLFFLHQCQGGHAYLKDGRSLVFDASGICNLEDCLSGNTHRAVWTSLKSSWDDMKTDNHVVSDFESASFLDVTCFLAMFRKYRRNNQKHCWSQSVNSLWYQLRWAVVALVSACVQYKARSIVSVNSDEVLNRSIPSRKKRLKRRRREGDGGDGDDSDRAMIVAVDNDSGEEPPSHGQGQGQGDRKRRQWVQMDLDEIWNVYSDSIELKGLSLQQISKTKSRSREGGVKESTCSNWLGKIQAMYKRRACMGFSGEQYYNLIGDASRHSTRETMVSAFFSANRDIACFAAAQVVQTAKTYPGEINCEPAVEKLLAQKKADRMATYRVFQALSNQLSNISGGSVTLNSFLVKDEPALGPLSPEVLHVCGGRNIKLVNKASRASVLVDFKPLEQMKVLILGMDQGSPGMAAAGFMHANMMVQCFFDPYHRLARDMKLAVSGAPPLVRQRLQLSQLSSAYLWSLSYKPFRQGSFFQDKVEFWRDSCNLRRRTELIWPKKMF